jgi:hypothetical protein
MFAKVLNWVSGGKVNPIIGGRHAFRWPPASASASPDEDFENFLLMHAMGANAAGQVASVVAGGPSRHMGRGPSKVARVSIRKVPTRWGLFVHKFGKGSERPAPGASSFGHRQRDRRPRCRPGHLPRE